MSSQWPGHAGLKGVCQSIVELGGKGSLPSWQQGVDLIVVVPVWKTQPWYLTILETCKDFPLLLFPQERNLIQPTHPQSMADVVLQLHVAVWNILRGRYKEQQLSEKAIELILTSWRRKSSKAYHDSQFQKCSERSADPISCPTLSVRWWTSLQTCFLRDINTDLLSLNTYRPAISSVHDKVDDIGQHQLLSRELFTNTPHNLTIPRHGMWGWWQDPWEPIIAFPCKNLHVSHTSATLTARPAWQDRWGLQI